MCGIVGYIGDDRAVPFLLQGLEKLEYRGYDSAGVAIYGGGKINIVKAKGRLSVLAGVLDNNKPLMGTLGIGHTRWATHGAPSDVNSHPHLSENEKFAVVHNGIIENYLSLKEYLGKKGIEFQSETDTEVVAQLLEYYYNGECEGKILDTIAKVMSKVEGSYALGIICEDYPDRIFCVRKDSPLIIGKGDGENYLASDIPAILSRTREIVRIKDKEICVLTKNSMDFYNLDLEPIEKETETIEWDIASAEKGGYPHFMLKEIHEQPDAVRKTVSPRIKDGRIALDEISLTAEKLRNINKIYFIGCGTAYHVGVAAKYTFEKLVRIQTEADVASEFRYREPLLDENTLVLITSQSGETADTLAALREAKKHGSHVISIVNVVGSTIANESDDVIYTWAGPEISVASTKAYSTQLAVMYMIAIYLADLKGAISAEDYDKYMADLQALPEKIEETLRETEKIQYFASKSFNANDMYFIGRNVDYAVSLEASLKLKEISYIHSEAYTGGELKHGPISLIEPGTLVIAFASYGKLFDKMLSNIKEVKARGAVVLGVTTQGRTEIESETDFDFYVPEVSDFMLPSVEVVPFQLFAYYVAAMRGCDIDKPRNLAKSVTVE
ncbi:MAG: glutamine--fructose-6-phosphate transaminase (isomerizing) [Clostridia bacterium]|nr:glutamine--fructose-6-phosphate transaminase (isomerizing) [Clostridia bacterium]